VRKAIPDSVNRRILFWFLWIPDQVRDDKEVRNYRVSFGNGSALRSSSVGWLFDDENTVLKEAERSAEITHNHPEGIKGAHAIAFRVNRTGIRLLKLNVI
jgi:ADP-ribosylglycohydrolase